MSTMQKRAGLDYLLRHGWLSGQSADLQDKVIARLCVQVFAAGTIVFTLGDPPGGVYAVVTGSLAVSIATGRSGPHFAHIAGAGSWFGEGAFMTRQPRRIGLETMSESVLAYLPLADMEQLAADDPEVLRAFGQIAIYNLGTCLLAVEDLLIVDPARRVAAVLWRSVGGRSGAEIPVTQAELGRLANTSRKRTLSAVKKLSALGLVRQGYHRIEVVEADRLRRFADQDESDA